MLLALFPWIPTLLLAAAPAAGRVSSETDCPTAAAVEAHLSAGAAATAGAAPRARIVRTGGPLVVQLLDEAGTPLAERPLPEGTCDDRAVAAAVFVEAWSTQLAAPPAPLGRLDPRPARLAPGAGWAWTVGVGLGLSAAGGPPALGAVDVTLRRRGGRAGLRLALLARQPGRARLPPGAVDWLRGAVAVGPSFAWTGRSARVEGIGEALGGVARARGRGFAEDRSSTAFGPGLGGLLRVALSRAAWEVRGEGGARRWLSRTSAEIRGLGEVELPRTEAYVGLGIARTFSP